MINLCIFWIHGVNFSPSKRVNIMYVLIRCTFQMSLLLADYNNVHRITVDRRIDYGLVYILTWLLHFPAVHRLFGRIRRGSAVVSGVTHIWPRADCCESAASRRRVTLIVIASRIRWPRAVHGGHRIRDT